MNDEHKEGSTFQDEVEEEITYAEILGNLALNGELVIVIPSEQEAAVKTGLKNLKAKQSTRMKADGLAVPEETLEFISQDNKEFEDCISLHIVLKKKGAVKIKKMFVPDNTL